MGIKFVDEVRVFEECGCYIAPFENWVKVKEGESLDDIKWRFLSDTGERYDSYQEALEDFEKHYNELMELFEEWCEENDLYPQDI